MELDSLGAPIADILTKATWYLWLVVVGYWDGGWWRKWKQEVRSWLGKKSTPLFSWTMESVPQIKQTSIGGFQYKTLSFSQISKRCGKAGRTLKVIAELNLNSILGVPYFQTQHQHPPPPHLQEVGHIIISLKGFRALLGPASKLNGPYEYHLYREYP